MGAAVVPAVPYARRTDTRQRARTHWCIALGALLPGIGGMITRFGHVEMLYATEFLGLCLIAAGDRLSVGPVTGALAGLVLGRKRSKPLSRLQAIC